MIYIKKKLDPGFRYVNTRIAVNPRRTSVYATE